jgi:hypothetical protein
MRACLCDGIGTPVVPKTPPDSSYRQDMQSPQLPFVHSTQPSAAQKALCETLRAGLFALFTPPLSLSNFSCSC